ncbi:Crp/Fnr family transcriptional regulator [Acetobacterium woodii]|uniref:Catabolite gene activator Crp n=1 Tax=Acetobacterium woodii (strain ATCC 29683 / DSM 1030 / JCM 2381 / KCTC 1655 / WB1) TaxID=931626 RepID=H6LGH8_ACEWD|nr:Crp/Fnr family transcriptional regulator [Acetobacterium woodii]AFA48306.1 catabolite gene activator Crp [Acetobacterium woodii DSM 1030]
MQLQYYFSDDFSAFENYFSEIKHKKRRYKKNEPVNAYGEPMDEMYYIISGMMSGSFIHESGNVKISSFYGKGYLAPLYFPGEIEMMRSFAFTAVTDLEVYVFKRNTFDQYINGNPNLNIAMYSAYIKLVSLNGQELANQLFSTGMEKICNFFYVYLTNTSDHENKIPFSQYTIGEFVGLNRANVAKYLKVLRDEKVIETHRNQIFILNMEKMRTYCSKNI